MLILAILISFQYHLPFQDLNWVWYFSNLFLKTNDWLALQKIQSDKFKFINKIAIWINFENRKGNVEKLISIIY